MHKLLSFRLVSLLLLAFVFVGLSSESDAQKLASKRRTFPAHGFEFKPLDDMSDVPINEGLASRGVVGQFTAAKLVPIKMKESGNRYMYAPDCQVVRLNPAAAETGKDAGRSRKPKTVEDVIESVFAGFSKIDFEEAERSNPKVAKGMDAERIVITQDQRFGSGTAEIVLDVYAFQLDGYKVVCLWDYPASKKYRKKWDSAIRKSMKTLRRMKKGADKIDIAEVNSESNYEDLLAFHTHDVEQTPGWRLVETKAKQYLIKTNIPKQDKKVIDLVIKRIEASRRLYEEDFPPATPITSVSVIRLCGSEEEFHTYGGTGAGVAGWFNPGTEELVLYLGGGSKSATLSVMTHEGFHQYCHFLFNRSTAHRWFDEGHGDYYGAWEMKGKKLVPNEDMKDGLARIPEIKKMFKEGTIKPLSAHLRFTHSEWQSQGPSNVSCYAQSFSIIRFLRDGARGKVKKRYWKKEYETILPNYIKSLNDGYQAAYAKIVEEAKKDLAALEKSKDPSAALILRMKETIASPWDSLGYAEGGKIREVAMNESWGLIDEDEFEERWLEFVDNVL